MTYGQKDHSHCWDQHYPVATHPETTACGIKPEDHKVCCLCTVSKPEEEGDWEKHKEESRERRWRNYEKSTGILASKKIPFRVLNEDVGHLRVDERFDFWPTTGVFIEMKTHKKGRGVFELIKALNNITV